MYFLWAAIPTSKNTSASMASSCGDWNILGLLVQKLYMQLSMTVTPYFIKVWHLTLGFYEQPFIVVVKKKPGKKVTLLINQWVVPLIIKRKMMCFLDKYKFIKIQLS